MLPRPIVLAVLAALGACRTIPANAPITEPPPAPPGVPPVELQTLSETQPFSSVAVLQGSLYAGSPAGVVRFDLRTGQHTRLSRQQGLPGNQVFALAGHPDSGLWVATDGGISRFHQGVWTNLPRSAGATSVNSLVATAEGVWAGESSGLTLLSGGERKLVLPGARVTVMRLDHTSQGIWVGTDGEGIYHTAGAGQSLTSHSLVHGQPLRQVRSITFSPEGGLVAVGRDQQGEHRLAFFDGRYWTAFSLSPPGELHWAERVGAEVMIGHGDRVIALRRLGPPRPGEPVPQRGPVTLTATRTRRTPPQVPVPGFLTRVVQAPLPARPLAVFGDGAQVYFGTAHAGVAVFDGQQIGWYRTRDLIMGSDRLRVGCAAAGSCYLATSEAGAFRLDGSGLRPISIDEDSTVRVQTFAESAGTLLAVSISGDNQSLLISQLQGDQFRRQLQKRVIVPEGAPAVRFARVGPGGKLWVGLTYLDREGHQHPWGVAILDASEQVVYHRSTLTPMEDRAPGSLALPDDIRDILFRGDEVWFSTSSGVCRVRGTKVDLFTENEGLESEIVYGLAWGPTGQLFAASHGGVGRFDGRWWRFDLPGVLRSPSRALLPQGDQLWVGTSLGLVAWTPSSSRLINAVAGLASDNVLDLYLEGEQRLWILTDNGLSILKL